MDWIYEAIGGILLWIDQFFCWVLSLLYSFFDVFAGTKKVTFGGERKYLINVFFEDTPAARIYAYMAMIGIVLSFAFTIYAVIKKIFDIDDKVKNSLGGIVGNQLKCILFILLMNFIILLVLKSTNVLMERIVYVFNNPDPKANSREISFDSDQYATMGRIINTIGNYSLNPSYDSRYNINSCYNEIRDDLLKLNKEKVFNFSYDGYEDSWQYYITKIANAHDINEEQNIDEYNEGLVKAITACMEQIKVNKKFVPIEYFKNNIEPIKSDDTPFDVLIFLSGTSKAAWNAQYNKSPDFRDTLRYEYLKKGGKSIYDDDQVKEDFNVSIMKFDHLAIIILGVVLCRIFLSLCVNCIARIFNLMLLYLIAPFFAATTPMDDGEKTKQWSIAFIVQAFGVFGAVFGIRILMIFVSIIFNSDLVLFDDATLNFAARLIMVFAVSISIEQASKIVTGILANNAGFQSIQASDVGSAGASRIMSAAKSVGGSVARHTPFVSTGLNALKSAAGNSKMLGYTFGFGAGSKEGFDKAREAKNNPNHNAKIAENTEKLAEAVDKISKSMGGGEGGSGGKKDSSGSSASSTRKRANTMTGGSRSTNERANAREKAMNGGGAGGDGNAKNNQGVGGAGGAGGSGENASSSENSMKRRSSMPSAVNNRNRLGN